ncbi:hypothetical protein [Bradyrhizobium lablabi]|nr:hypothetical protein [Bradyrhizobium lablabi]MBR0698260.1 hypothetical protein [Bradyrhizobium lablabi]
MIWINLRHLTKISILGMAKHFDWITIAGYVSFALAAMALIALFAA